MVRRIACTALLALVLTAAQAARGQSFGERAATTALGGGAGVLAGGYITLSIVVAQAKYGHYMHSYKDLFDWKATSVIIGGATGAALGAFAPERLRSGFILGVGGTVVGLGTGMVLGQIIAEPPEGLWAGGAIGAGVGMALGSLAGVIFPDKAPFNTVSSKAVVPVAFTIHF